MKIHNIRLGFATNSSSTHSIMFFPGGAPKNHTTGDFGWSYFVASDEQTKKQYIAATVYSNIAQQYDWDSEEHQKIPYMVEQLVGVTPEEQETYGGVDHQSLLALPFDFRRRKNLDTHYLRRLTETLMREDVAILGGNDNGDGPHPESRRGKLMKHMPTEMGVLYSRYDPEYDFFTMMNQGTGAKMRFAFNDNPIVKTSMPELVDLKITDYCQFKCQFCYQGSTPEGQHASMEVIDRYIKALRNAGVMEVALGGGEPSSHPQFVEILRKFRRAGIVANWTTKDFSWLGTRLPEFIKLLKLSGGVAFSVNYLSELGKVEAAYRLLRSHGNITAQIILERFEQGHFETECLAPHITVPLTLLGYKTTGRGQAALRFSQLHTYDYARLIKKIKDAYHTVGIDTALMEKMEADLKDAKVPPHFYTGHEGQFSCYIDAVKQTIAPSSYCHSSAVLPFNGTAKDLKAKFKEF